MGRGCTFFVNKQDYIKELTEFSTDPPRTHTPLCRAGKSGEVLNIKLTVWVKVLYALLQSFSVLLK